MAKKMMSSNKVLSGTHGKLWVGSDKMSNVKSFEAKISGDFEELAVSEKMSKQYKYMGSNIEGTITLHKIDSYVASLVAEGFRTGNFPDITITAAIEDPAAYGYERIELTGVHFTELTLLKFETGTVGEEEVPFKAEEFRFADKIV